MKTAALAILIPGLCLGQATPQFDVVSIRPSRSSESGGGMFPIAGGVSAHNLSVGVLIQAAYNLKPWEISGGPGWVTTARYDIEAKGEGNPGFPEKMQMLRPLLADRFHLKFHRATRQMRIYPLIVAKGGPKLRSTADGVRGYIRPGRGLIEGQAMTRPTLAELLGGGLDQRVIDKTGITGRFDIELQWTPMEREVNFPGGDSPGDQSGPSIFTAIQEQLGLRLEPGKGPVEVLVIDRIARPFEN